MRSLPLMLALLLSACGGAARPVSGEGLDAAAADARQALAENGDLRSRIDELESQNADLEDRVNALEARLGE